MTSRETQIYRAFARGKSLSEVAEMCGVTYVQAIRYLTKASREVAFQKPGTTDIIRYQQYLSLLRIIDHAFAAFKRSVNEGVKEVSDETIETRTATFGREVRIKSVRIRRDSGDVRYLEIAIKALAEIRDLFTIGADAESKVGSFSRSLWNSASGRALFL